MTSLSREQLLKSARYFADIALNAYTIEDTQSILVNAAFSMEHVSKALLLSMHPTLLMEIRNGQFDSLLHLAGHGTKAIKLEEPRTIGAKEALARVRQVMNINTAKDPLDRLIEIRDGVVHIGSFSSVRTRELLTAFLRYANEAYDALNVLDEDRWGKRVGLVNTLIVQSLSEIEHEVHRKIEAARNNFRELMEKIPESEQASVADARQAAISPVMYDNLATGFNDTKIHAEYTTCPACSHTDAICIGAVQYEYDVPEKIGPMEHIEEHVELVDIYLEPRMLRCGVCGLELQEAEEITAANITPRIEITRNIRRYLY
ncbi:hypothetical protein [Streptosporangium canum]|uniref:hypothetical protein n=1 Tax=Streptosporangium canum TaxID=324952 RepID=UPI0037A0FD1C